MKPFTFMNKNGDIIAIIEADVWNEALDKFFQIREMGDSKQGLALIGVKRADLTINDTVIQFPR